MPRRSTKKERGVFEKDPGSEIWWIRYYIDGRERREKVGRKKDASDLYKIRKADALRGVKLPNNMKSKGVKFEALGKHALEWYIEHGRKDVKNFRIRMNIILKDFGHRDRGRDLALRDRRLVEGARLVSRDQEPLQERLRKDVQDRIR